MEYRTRHDWMGRIIGWELCKRLIFDNTYVYIYLYIADFMIYIHRLYSVWMYMSVNILHKVYVNEYSMQESNGISIIWMIFVANNDSDTWDFSYKNMNSQVQVFSCEISLICSLKLFFFPFLFSSCCCCSVNPGIVCVVSCRCN